MVCNIIIVIILIMCMNLATFELGFIISPEDMIIPEGLPAVFKCQQRTTPILWHVNGEFLRGNESNSTHISSIRVTGSTIIHTLTIVAELKFNNSVVECEAVYNRRSVTAKLVVQG